MSTPDRDDPAQEPDREYGKDFWSVSNALTAFAVAQSIVFLVAVGPHQSDLYVAVRDNQPLVVAAIPVATAIYIGIIVFCHHAQWKLAGKLSTNLRSFVVWWKWAEIVIVAALGVSELVVVGGVGWGPSINATYGPDGRKAYRMAGPRPTGRTRRRHRRAEGAGSYTDPPDAE